MGSGEDDVSENSVTFVEVVFMAVFIVGAAGNGLLVISAVTDPARLSFTCRLALVAGGLVLLALLFSALALAVKSRRLKQETVLKIRLPAAGKKPERWEEYKLEFAGGHVRYWLLVPFAGLGMFLMPIGFSTRKPDSDLLSMIIYFAVGLLLFLSMFLLFPIVGPPWTWIQVGRRSGWGVLFSAVLAPLKKNILRIALVFLALVFALLFLRVLNAHYL